MTSKRREGGERKWRGDRIGAAECWRGWEPQAPWTVSQSLPVCPIVQIRKREEATCQSPQKVGERERLKGGGEREDGLEKGKVEAASTRLWLVGLSFPICTLVTIPETGLIGRS